MFTPILPNGILKSRPIFLKKRVERNIIQSVLLSYWVKSTSEVRHIPRGKKNYQRCHHELSRPRDTRNYKALDKPLMRASSEAILGRVVTTHKALTTNKSLGNKTVFFILQSSFKRCSRWGGRGRPLRPQLCDPPGDRDAGKSLPHPNRGISLEANLKDCFKTSQPHYNTWLIPRIPQGTSAALKSLKVKVAQLCPTLQPHGLYNQSMEFSKPEYWSGYPATREAQEYWSGYPFPSPGDILEPRIEPRSQHCRRILYQFSHKGSLRILEWVAYPFSSRSSRHRNRTRVFCIAGGFFTSWATREAHSNPWIQSKQPSPMAWAQP